MALLGRNHTVDETEALRRASHETSAMQHEESKSQRVLALTGSPAAKTGSTRGAQRRGGIRAHPPSRNVDIGSGKPRGRSISRRRAAEPPTPATRAEKSLSSCAARSGLPKTIRSHQHPCVTQSHLPEIMPLRCMNLEFVSGSASACAKSTAAGRLEGRPVRLSSAETC